MLGRNGDDDLSVSAIVPDGVGPGQQTETILFVSDETRVEPLTRQVSEKLVIADLKSQ